MELSLKKLLPIGLIVLAVMFVMKMMKGKRCEGFSQQKAQKVECNCNVEKFSDATTPPPPLPPNCEDLKNPPDMLSNAFECDFEKDKTDKTAACQNLGVHLSQWICDHEFYDLGMHDSIDQCNMNMIETKDDNGNKKKIYSNELFELAKAYCPSIADM